MDDDYPQHSWSKVSQVLLRFHWHCYCSPQMCPNQFDGAIHSDTAPTLSFDAQLRLFHYIHTTGVLYAEA